MDFSTTFPSTVAVNRYRLSASHRSHARSNSLSGASTRQVMHFFPSPDNVFVFIALRLLFCPNKSLSVSLQAAAATPLPLLFPYQVNVSKDTVWRIMVCTGVEALARWSLCSLMGNGNFLIYSLELSLKRFNQFRVLMRVLSF